MIAFICSGGPSELLCSLEPFLNREDVLFIGADRGALTLYENGIVPSVMIGDFDSIDPTAFNNLKKLVPTIIFAEVEKDETDTDLALNYAVEKGVSEIVVTCVSGGRLDHEEAAKKSLLRVQLENKQTKCTIVSKQNQIQFLVRPNEWLEIKPVFRYVSFFAVNEMIKEVTLKQFKYETNEEPLSLISSRFTSNELKGDKGFIRFSNGICLMITSADV